VAASVGHTAEGSQGVRHIRICRSMNREALTISPKRISTFTAQFHTLLHSSLPSTFPSHFRSFLLNSLSALSSEHGSGPIPRSRSTAPSPHFNRLGVLPRYSGTLHRVALEEIEKIAREEADKGWESRRLSRARQRVGEGVAGWLGGMFEGECHAYTTLDFSRLTRRKRSSATGYSTHVLSVRLQFVQIVL